MKRRKITVETIARFVWIGVIGTIVFCSTKLPFLRSNIKMPGWLFLLIVAYIVLICILIIRERLFRRDVMKVMRKLNEED